MPLDNTRPSKICRRCRIRTPVENFQTRRHKICASCEERQRRESLHYLASLQEATGTPKPPALTRTREGLRKYNRERARARAPDRKPPLYPDELKLCSRCQLRKPRNEFDSWRHRICIKCDGPRLHI